MKRLSSFVAFAATLALPLTAIAADPIPKAKWRGAKMNSRPTRSDRSGSDWIKDGGTLATRSQKPGGGYYYHPVCKYQGEIGMAFPTSFEMNTQRFSCLGKGGAQLVPNGEDFTWEPQQHVAQRGRISIYSLTYEWRGKTRVVCSAKVGSNEVPGSFELPPAGEMPTKCNVMLMGQWVSLPIYAVAKAKTTGLPSLPSDGNGWWTPPADWPKSKKGAEPLFQVKDQKRRVLCRVKTDSGYVSGVRIENTDHTKRRSTACKYRHPGADFYGIGYNYDVFIGSGGSDWGPLKSGTSTNFSNAVLVNPSSSASSRVYACQDSSGRGGWVKATDKRCYTVDGPSTGLTTYRTLMK